MKEKCKKVSSLYQKKHLNIIQEYEILKDLIGSILLQLVELLFIRTYRLMKSIVLERIWLARPQYFL